MAPPLKKIPDVVRALQRAKGNPIERDWGKAVFLIGAGCSVSAGIPAGAEVAADCAMRLVRTYSNNEHEEPDGEAALAWLKEKGYVDEAVSMNNAYGVFFRDHYQDPVEQQEIIRSAIDKGNGNVNWAHLCLGQLIKDGYVNTVLTTNFDQLVLEGVVRTGLIPVVADGVESLARIKDRQEHPQVVHLHGSLHTYNPRNSPEDLSAVAQDPHAIRALTSLIGAATVFIVVGYAGGEEGVMELLINATENLRDKVIYWVQYSENPDDLSPQATKLLENSRQAGLIPGEDADGFFIA